MYSTPLRDALSRLTRIKRREKERRATSEGFRRYTIDFGRTPKGDGAPFLPRPARS